MTGRATEVGAMALVWIGLVVSGLVVLDVLALRYGAWSRRADHRRDWW